MCRVKTVLKINSVYWRYCFKFNERQPDLHKSSKVSSKVMPYHLTHFVFLCKWVWKESEYWINQSGLALLFLWRCNLLTPLPWGCTVIDENDKQIPAFKALWGHTLSYNRRQIFWNRQGPFWPLNQGWFASNISNTNDSVSSGYPNTEKTEESWKYDA